MELSKKNLIGQFSQDFVLVININTSTVIKYIVSYRNCENGEIFLIGKHRFTMKSMKCEVCSNILIYKFKGQTTDA